jgi:hypothetical protein
MPPATGKRWAKKTGAGIEEEAADYDSREDAPLL